MRRIARTALAVGLALGIQACGSQDASSDAGDVAGEGLASAPAAVDTGLGGDTAIIGGMLSDTTTVGSSATGSEAVDGRGSVPPGESPRTQALDGTRDVPLPSATAAPDSEPARPAPAERTVAEAPPSATGSAPAPAASSPARPPARDEPLRRPFNVGERLTYEVRFGPLAVGTATMQVLDITTVRGIPAYHTRFEVRGGNRLYRVHDRYESWFDTRNLASLRYMQDIDQGNYERTSVFEIYPDQRRFVEEGKEPQPTVEFPLDEGSFIYWMRTIPLEVGQVYLFDRYFRPDRNPVRIEVLRRERVKVPAGTFDAIVVRPVIKTRGIFSEGGRAEIWFADDSTRRIIQMKSRLSFGSLNLYLK